MKRTAAILILGILFFNWFGYRMFTSYMEDQSNTVLEAQLDENNYNESELISIKVPAVHLPYYTNSTQFERVDGQVEIEGVQYKYVKRRLFNDSLELMCIPNHSAMNLQTARDDFFKLVNDLQHPGKGRKNDAHPGSSKSFSFDYYSNSEPLNLTVFSSVKKIVSSYYIVSLATCYSPTAEQPPESHC